MVLFKEMEQFWIGHHDKGPFVCVNMFCLDDWIQIFILKTIQSIEVDCHYKVSLEKPQNSLDFRFT